MTQRSSPWPQPQNPGNESSFNRPPSRQTRDRKRMGSLRRRPTTSLEGATSAAAVVSALWVINAVFSVVTDVAGDARAGASSPYPSRRVKDLVSAMSLPQKVGQMAQVDLPVLLVEDGEGRTVLSEEKAEYYFGNLSVGSLLNTPHVPWNASQYREAAILIQTVARKYNNPPVIWGLDSVHSANFVKHAILTPQQINMAATFNTTVAFEAGRLASRDTRAAGINWIFSPILGLAIESRWPRVYETFGEDPHLASEMGVHIVQGLQFPDGDPGAIPGRAAACGKHFLGYSSPQGGHDRAPSLIPERHLHQYFVPPWRAVIERGKVMTVMESYTEYDGVPNVANGHTTGTLLRDVLGFREGVLVTDYNEVDNLANWHRVADSTAQAAIWALQEGSIDMSMAPTKMEDYLDALLEGLTDTKKGRGALDEGRIDLSVERVLTLKERLGMLDSKLSPQDVNIAKVGRQSDREMALDMARQGIVLVKNHGHTLPINKSWRVKIHVTGPTSDALQYQSGGWSVQWEGVLDDLFTYGTTVYEAMAAANTDWDVTHSCGVDIQGLDCGSAAPSLEDMSAAASNANYIVVCIGEENYAEKPGDIRSLALPVGQHELVRAAKNAAKGGKLILVYFGGRARLLGDMVDHADAIFISLLPGPDAGQAMVDLISGFSNPSGRLPITYPKYEDGAGAPYYHAVSDQCTEGDGQLPHFDFGACEVQWHFGYGLSYTTFEYRDLAVSPTSLVFQPPGQSKNSRSVHGGDKVTVSLKVKNVGSRPGSESVLFFTFDHSRLVTPEYKRLRSFDKVHLLPGEEAIVKAEITIDDTRYVGPHDSSHLVLQNGMRFRVGVGPYIDCRYIDEKGSSELCSDFVTVDAGENYVGACDAACTVWGQSGCDRSFGLTTRKCWEMCTSGTEVSSTLSGAHEGWGWNYVGCIESVSRLIDVTKRGDDQCWKMTTMCHNIFDQNLIGEHPYTRIDRFAGRQGATGLLVGFVAGAIGSVMMLLVCPNQFRRFMRRWRVSGENRGRDIEFAPVLRTQESSSDIS